jgi:hypothetical protein
MKFKFGILFVAACFCSMSYAQLSTRENTTAVFKTGSRPLAGSYGLFIGPSIQDISDMANSDQFTWRGLPLINIKYYSTDNVEWRLGLQFSGKSSSSNGKTSATTPVDYVNTEKNSFNRISVGGAYHFSPKNLLDVYTGAYIPLGWDTYHKERTLGTSGIVTSKFSPVIGLGAYIGLQAFIADLPISVGLEYGLSGIARGGKQYKNVATTSGKSQTYYTEDNNAKGTSYSKLSLGDSSFGTDVRITFSYYFNK